MPLTETGDFRHWGWRQPVANAFPSAPPVSALQEEAETKGAEIPEEPQRKRMRS